MPIFKDYLLLLVLWFHLVKKYLFRKSFIQTPFKQPDYLLNASRLLTQPEAHVIQTPTPVLNISWQMIQGSPLTCHSVLIPALNLILANDSF